MFTDRFTFNSSSTSDGNGGTYDIASDFHLKSNIINNIIYKKTIIFLIKTIGLGDIIDFITHYTGIKYIIIKITKGKCGCEARRKKFNQYVSIPYLTIELQPITNIPKNNMFELKEPGSESVSRIKKPCGCGAKKKV